MGALLKISKSKIYFTKEFTLIGSVDKGGRIFNLKYQDTFDDKASTTLVRALYTLPILDLTLVDGIPVQSRINFGMVYIHSSGGCYH